MKIVFVMRLAVPVHMYRDIIRALCKRGHRVTILFDTQWFGGRDKGTVPPPLEELMQELSPLCDYDWVLHRKDFWRFIIFPVRQLLGYRRYFFVRQSSFFRDRWMKLFPRWLAYMVRMPFAKVLIKSKMGGKILWGFEYKTPADKKILAQIKNLAPDIMIGPIGNMRYGSVDSDYMKAARALGIPLVIINGSWDSLTTKGAITIIPDLLLVWNETQIKEAEEHHRIDRRRIRIIGAPVWDRWIRFKPQEKTREEFCRFHKIRPEDPILLYLGSSGNIARDETHLLPELRNMLDRAPDARLRKTKIIVRPHPAHAAIYETLNLRDTIVLPRGGEAPDRGEAQQLFYDCLRFSIAATGLYTSAMIEAIIVGAPVIPVIREEYRKTQEEAQYFRHVAESGAIATAGTMDALLDELVKLLDGDDSRVYARKKFVTQFIRPYGNSVSASERAVLELEKFVEKDSASC